MSQQNTPLIKTERLILRRFEESDIEAIYQIHSDEEVNTFLPHFPLKTIDEARPYFENRYARAYQKPAGYMYAVCLKEKSMPIGYAEVFDLGKSNELGYGLAKAFWHQGIISEACQAIIHQLRTAGYAYITVTHDVKNWRSGGVMKKLGMHYCYSYKELVQPKNKEVIFRMYQLNLKQDAAVYMGYLENAMDHQCFKERIEDERREENK